MRYAVLALILLAGCSSRKSGSEPAPAPQPPKVAPATKPAPVINVNVCFPGRGLPGGEPAA